MKFGTKAAAIATWADTQIKVKVPILPRGSKAVCVYTRGGASNPATFVVK